MSTQDRCLDAEATERGLRAIDLPQTMVLVPLPEAWWAETPTLGFQYLSAAVAEWAASASARQPIAYVEQWTFAGPGEQSAVVWAGGSIVFGPRFTSTEGDCEPPIVFVGRHEPTAVHLALRELGVDATGHLDEYAALGLDAKRHTEDWLA